MTPPGDLEGRGLHDRLDEEVQGGPDAVGWGWTWETCRGATEGLCDDDLTLRTCGTG